MSEQREDYQTIEEAMKELGVTRGSIYYYKGQLHFDFKKFPLDRRKYIRRFDVARIKQAREAARQ